MRDTYIYKQFISSEYFDSLDILLSSGLFEDGKGTATAGAQKVKNNLQLSQKEGGVYNKFQELLGHCLQTNSGFHERFYPLKMTPFIIGKYTEGMGYGNHIDSPIMGQPAVRTDLAMTVFLCDPIEYEGGELVLETAFGEFSYKLEKGDAVVYPATYIHRVNEVSKGERKVAVSWIQSYVRNESHRQMLTELKNVQNDMFLKDENTSHSNKLLKVWSNLLREWSEL